MALLTKGCRKFKANKSCGTLIQRYSTMLNIKEDTGKHTPYGSLGSSLYSLATKGCFDVMNNATPSVLKCIQEIIDIRNQSQLSQTPFSIADFGTADGGTSIPMIYKIISMIRSDKNHENTPIQILYEDQPGNDWNSLFNNIQNKNNNKIQINPDEYYTQQFDNIYALCCGNSFYEPCFLNNSVDFIFSGTAMHWLSSIPCPIPNALHSAMLSDNDEIKQKYSKQAAEDYNTILLHRSRELKEYGKMMIVNFCTDEQGQYLGNTLDGKINMHQLFCELWNNLCVDGVITDQEFSNTNFVNHYRSIEEMATFDAVIPLNLVELKSDVVRCPFHQNLIENSSQNPFDYATSYLPTLRTWSNSTFISGLSEDRDNEEKKMIVDQLFDCYFEDVLNDPTLHGMDYVHGYATFAKQ